MADIKFEVDKDKLEVRISYSIKATPERLWAVYTEPEHLAKWWRNTTIEKQEVKVGGAWRFVDHGKDGSENHAFRGEYTVVDKPNKLSRTFEYEPWAGHVMEESVTFTPKDGGQTDVLTVSKFKNVDDLDNMVNSGMEKGSRSGLERLIALAEEN